MANTPNQGYPLPDGENDLAADVTRLITALTGIDSDIAGLLTSLAARAPLVNPAFAGAPTAPTPANDDNSVRIATTAFVQALFNVIVSGYAPTESPEFTGVPTAPTAAPGTNTTQIATMAALKAAIDGLLDAAPGALDTLNELAAALGDDPDFAATVTTALAAKLDSATALTTYVKLASAAIQALSGGFSQSVVTLTPVSGVLTLDFSLGNHFKATLVANTSLVVANLPAAGTRQEFTLDIIQDATGGRTLSYASAFKWPGRTAAPSITTTANAINTLTGFANSTDVVTVFAGAR